MIGESLPQLLNDPSTRGMSRDIEMQHASAIMTYDEEALEDAERQRWYSEEVHRGDRFAMVAQKRQPMPRGFRISWCLSHPAGDRWFGNVETEHEKFAADARGAPDWILCHHAKDQIANFFRNPSSADPPARFGDSTPIECKPRSMPTDHGLGTDDHQGLFPFRPKPSCHDPEQLIQGCEPWPGIPSLHCQELLTESLVLKQ